MKKLFVLLLAIMLLLASSSAAETSKYFGTWVSISYAGGTYFLTLFQLFDDHTAYYLSRDVEADGIEQYNESIIEWEETDDGIILHVNDNYSPHLHEHAEGWLHDGGTIMKTYYHKTFPVSVPSAGSTASGSTPAAAADLDPIPAEGLTVPSGVYIADEDFPSGTYRIEMVDEKNAGLVTLYKQKGDVNKAFSYLFEYTLGSFYGTTVVGKIEINPGYALMVTNTVIKLLPYEGLK